MINETQIRISTAQAINILMKEGVRPAPEEVLELTQFILGCQSEAILKLTPKPDMKV